jgi:hypothetical protein
LAGGLDRAYLDIADELKAEVAPVGMAWKKALAADPSLILHQADNSHPNPKGSYLAACVLYATLLDKTPVGLTGEIKKRGRVLVQIAPDEARRLQKIAWQTVREKKHRRATGKPSYTNPVGGTPIHMGASETSLTWIDQPVGLP